MKPELPPIVVTQTEWERWVSETHQAPTDTELNDMATRYGVNDETLELQDRTPNLLAHQEANSARKTLPLRSRSRHLGRQ